MDPSDLIISNHDGKVTSGGYQIQNNSFLSQKMSPMLTQNSNKTRKGGNPAMSDLFKDLAVPAGLFYMQSNYKRKNFNSNNHDMLSEPLFDRLLKFINKENKKNFDITTRKKRRGKQNKTKKNKN